MVPRNKQAHDRRAFARVSHDTPAVISTARGEVEATVIDISVAGLQLEFRGPLDSGEFVRVRFPVVRGEQSSWIDPDAIVVRTVPDPTTGHNKVGLSFLALAPAVLQRLSDRVAEVLAEEQRSDEAPSPLAPAAHPAGPGATKPGSNKPWPRAKPRAQAAQASASKTGLSVGEQRPPNPPHPAPSATANGLTTARPGGAKPTGIAQTLARLFGLRGETKTPAPKLTGPERPAPSMPGSQPSPAELRDLFRSAVVSVQSDEKKTRKR